MLFTARNCPLYDSIEECKHVYFLQSTCLHSLYVIRCLLLSIFSLDGVDLAFGGKYSYGPRFVPKAGGGGGGSRFGWKVQLWTSFRTESRGWWGWISLRMKITVMDLVSYQKQGMVGVDLVLDEMDSDGCV